MNTAMEWVWAGIVFGCLAWYALTAVYIAIKGAFDIQTMLGHLRPPEKQAPME